jgi:hypothetical protein
MISCSVKELLKQITIRGMYFYSIKSCFYGVHSCVLKIFTVVLISSTVISLGVTVTLNPSGVNALSLGFIADADNGNAYENQDETYVLHATIE